MYVKCTLCRHVFLALWLRKEKSKVCFRVTKTLLPVARKTAIRTPLKTLIMARPAKNRKEQRYCYLHIRLTPDEMEKLQTLYKRTAFPSLSQFVRLKLFDRRFDELVKYSLSAQEPALALRNEKLDTLRKEINRIGTNINQIAKHVNAKKSVSAQQLKEVKEMVEKIYTLLD